MCGTAIRRLTSIALDATWSFATSALHTTGSGPPTPHRSTWLRLAGTSHDAHVWPALAATKIEFSHAHPNREGDPRALSRYDILAAAPLPGAASVNVRERTLKFQLSWHALWHNDGHLRSAGINRDSHVLHQIAAEVQAKLPGSTPEGNITGTEVGESGQDRLCCSGIDGEFQRRLAQHQIPPIHHIRPVAQRDPLPFEISLLDLGVTGAGIERFEKG